MSVHRIRLAGPWELAVDESSGVSTIAEQLSDFPEWLFSGKSEGRPRPYGLRRVQLPYSLEATDAFTLPENNFWLCRAFHRPNGLTDRTSVRLVVAYTGSVRRVVLNSVDLTDLTPPEPGGQTLPADTRTAVFCITEHLQTFNRMAVCLKPAKISSQNASLNSVTLEIEEKS